MKIVYIGAGSTQFALGVMRDLLSYPEFYGTEMALTDIDENRLRQSKDFLEKYVTEANGKIAVSATTDRRAALKGADYIIVTVKAGGYASDEKERAICEMRGYYHGIGDHVSDYYGGVGAFRQLSFFDKLAQDIEELCPNAWVVSPTNPVFEVSTYMLRAHPSVNFVGMCHGHWGAYAIPGVMGLDFSRFQFETYGFDHCLFVTRMTYDGEDLYPRFNRWLETEFESFWEETCRKEDPRFNFTDVGITRGSVEMYRQYGLFPVGDTLRSVAPWWQWNDYTAHETYYGRSGGMDSHLGWPSYLEFNNRQRAEMFGRLESGESLCKLYPIRRPGADDMAHVRIIHALFTGQKEYDVLSVPNRGLVDAMPSDVTVNISVCADRFGVHGIRPAVTVPRRLENNVLYPRMIRCSNMVDAYMENDRTLLKMELAQDHRTVSWEQASSLIDELLDQPWNMEAAKHYYRG